MDYVPLCHFLNVPLYSGDPQTLLYIQSKSGMKEFYKGINSQEDKDFGVLPYCSDIFSSNSFINELALLIVKYPLINRWVLKIDSEIDSRGIACFDITKIIPQKLLINMRKEEKAEKVLKKYLEEVYGLLDEGFIQKKRDLLQIIRPKVYQSQE